MIPIVWMLTRAPLEAIPQPVWLVLICGMAVGLCSTIPLQLHWDTRRSWAVETDTWHGTDLAELPAPRAKLTELPRRTPVTTPEDDAQVDQPSTELVERFLVGLRRWDTPRHACDVVAQTPLTYEPLHLRSVGEVTQEFARIVAEEFGAQRCESCTVGWEPEPAHASCIGCSCPCSVVEPLPEGVEGHALAGGTHDAHGAIVAALRAGTDPNEAVPS